jgi:beta-ureidopropionase / N-carbamoyl-L-amino-acid hydrolase
MVVEFRETSVNTLDRLERAFLEWVISAGRTVTVGAEPIARIAPAAMAPQLGEMLAAAATRHGDKPLSMPSGAGHDAMFLASRIPAAMMFVPSIGGRSHDISENTAEGDIIFGCQVLATATEVLIRA